jgi:hypothetical protein
LQKRLLMTWVTVVSLESTVLKKYPSVFSADHSIEPLAFSYCPPKPAVALSTCSRSPVPLQWISRFKRCSPLTGCEFCKYA